MDNSIGLLTRIDKDLKKDFKIICIKKDVQMNDVLVGFIRDFVNTNKNQACV